MRKKRIPIFIAVEGGEGSGKSSMLREFRNVHGDDLVGNSREPGGSPYAEVIREAMFRDKKLSGAASPFTMMCLMFGTRGDHTIHTLVPRRKAGKVLLSDRFDASSYAYNVCAQSDGELEDLFWMMRKSLPIVPDVYIFFDVDVKTGLQRARSRNQQSAEGNHFDAKKIDFHKKVRAGYLKFFKKPGIKHITIDANLPYEQVKENFIALMEKLLGIPKHK